MNDPLPGPGSFSGWGTQIEGQERGALGPAPCRPGHRGSAGLITLWPHAWWAGLRGRLWVLWSCLWLALHRGKKKNCSEILLWLIHSRSHQTEYGYCT